MDVLILTCLALIISMIGFEHLLDVGESSCGDKTSGLS
jgi:hypothetical protein